MVRILGTFLILVILPTALLAAHAYSQARQDALEMAEQDLVKSAQNVAADIDRYVESEIAVARYGALSAQAQEFARVFANVESSGVEPTSVQVNAQVAVDRWLQSWVGSASSISIMFILDSDGTCVASSDPELLGHNFAQRPYFQSAMAGQSTVSDWSIGLVTGVPGIYMSAPIASEDGTPAAVLVAKLDVAPITELVTTAGTDDQVEFLINDAGVVLLESGNTASGLRTLTELSQEDAAAIAASQQFADSSLTSMGLTDVRAAQETLRSGGTVVTDPFTYAGHVWVAALTKTSAEGWTVGVAIRADQITAQLRVTTLVFLAFAGFMLVYIALAVIFLRRSILTPLAELVAGSERVSAGDFDTAVPIHGGGEVAQLARSFNSMAQQIRDNTQRLESEVAARTAALEQANREVMALSLTDELTGSYNRRYLEAFLPQALRRMQRHELPLSILMVDIDHFKHVNDTHGHQVGDLVLIAFAECLRQSSPDPDWVVRFGGEEFLIALLEVDRAEAYAIAERLREHIAEMRVDIGDGEQVAITASIGVATSAPGQDLEDVIAHADRALYRAKRDGRNLVRAES
mgnify:CR=1 FL=1